RAVVLARGAHIDLEAWITREAGLEGIECGGIGEAHGHGSHRAAAPVGRAHYCGIAPDLGIMGIAALEGSDHGPELSVELERRTDIDARELLACTLAYHEFAQTGLEPATGDEPQLRIQLPAAFADAT